MSSHQLPVPVKHLFEVLSSIAALDLGNLFRRSGSHDLATALAAFWSEVNQLVR